MGLPFSQRIRKRGNFQLIFNKGKFAKGKLLLMWAYHSSHETKAALAPRAGIIVSRKTDPRATQRNLWKRRIREAFRELQAKVKENSEILIKARECEIPAYQEIKQELEMLFRKTESLKL